MGEVEKMLENEAVSLKNVEESVLDTEFLCSESEEIFEHSGGGSGGFLEHVVKYAAEKLNKEKLEKVEYKVLRNNDFQEVTLELDGKPPLKMALAYGFRNIQNVVQKIKRGKCPHHFVEIMACPSGCNNGGGQLKPDGEETLKERLAKVTELYKSVSLTDPWNNSKVDGLYLNWLGGEGSERACRILHTQYHEVEKMTNALAIKW